MERREQEQPLTRNWNELTRFQQIEARHRIYDTCTIPNEEYTASWWDVKELLNQHATLVAQRERLVAALKNAMKVVSDRAAGGRMLTTSEEASAVWDRCAKVLYDIEQATNALATVARGGRP